KTLLPFHRALLATEQWAKGETCRDLIEDAKWLKALAFPAADATDDDAEQPTVAHDYTVEVSGKRFDVKVIGAPSGGLSGALPGGPGAPAVARKPARRERAGAASGG